MKRACSIAAFSLALWPTMAFAAEGKLINDMPSWLAIALFMGLAAVGFGLSFWGRNYYPKPGEPVETGERAKKANRKKALVAVANFLLIICLVAIALFIQKVENEVLGVAVLVLTVGIIAAIGEITS